MMTRDSKFWWVGIVMAVLVSISSRWDLIDPLLPAQHTDKVHALIELISLIVGIVSGKMATSPLKGENDGTKVKLQ